MKGLPGQALSARFAGRQRSAGHGNDQVASMIAIATGAVATTTFITDRLRAPQPATNLFATEGADYLRIAASRFAMTSSGKCCA